MNQNDFTVLLKTILDNSSISTELDKVQKIVEKYHINVTADLDKTKLTAEVRKVISEINKSTGVNIEINDKDIIKAINQVETAAIQAEKAKQKEIEKTNAEMAKAKQIVEKSASKIRYDIEVGDTKTKIASIEAQFVRLGLSQTEAKDKVAGLRTALSDLDKINDDKTLITRFENLNTEIQKVSNSAKIMKSTLAKNGNFAASNEKIDATIARLNEQLRKNSAYSRKSKAEIKGFLDELAKGVTESRLKEINTEAQKIHANMANLNKIGFSWMDKMKNGFEKFSSWFGIATIFTKATQAIGNMKDEVFELNNSLLELSKVSDLTKDGIVEVTDQAYKLGDTVGKTGSQVIDAVTEFKRAGYEMQNSFDMAESALVMTNVAEGIKETSDAAGTLISVLKGYNMAATETTAIVDKLNEVDKLASIHSNVYAF